MQLKNRYTILKMIHFSLSFNIIEIIIISVVALLFFIELFYYLYFFNRPTAFIRKKDKKNLHFLQEYPPLSVVVYTKNDAENLEKYLPEILEQEYPQYEVIVVNDGSTDDTKDVTSALECRYKHLYQTYIPDEARNLSRKKLALTLGIKAAKYDIIVLTHANCHPGSRIWLQKIARNFIPGIDIVIGHAYMSGHTSRYAAFNRLMYTLKYLSFALLNRPYRGTGANLAYRKSLFFENKGFSQHLNLHFGDDDLFINEIAGHTNTRTELSPESHMITEYDDNYRAWKELKLQYDFTSRYLHTKAKILFPLEELAAWLFYAGTFFLIITGIFYNAVLSVIGLLLLIIHFVIQTIVYRNAAKLLNGRKLAFSLPFFTLIHPFANLYFRLLGRFSRNKNYTWGFQR